MSDPLVKIHYHEEVATIILDRAEKRNALNRALLSELGQALHDLGLEKKVRAVILPAGRYEVPLGPSNLTNFHP